MAWGWQLLTAAAIGVAGAALGLAAVDIEGRWRYGHESDLWPMAWLIVLISAVFWTIASINFRRRRHRWTDVIAMGLLSFIAGGALFYGIGGFVLLVMFPIATLITSIGTAFAVWWISPCAVGEADASRR